MRLTDRAKLCLVRTVSMKVKNAIFQMHPEKASGPDGFNVSFFKSNWSLLDDHVSKKRIQYFFRRGKLLEEVKHIL